VQIELSYATIVVATGDGMSRVDENEFFRQVTVRMASSLDLPVALRRTMTYLETAMPASLIALALFEPANQVVRLVSLASATKGMRLDVALPLTDTIKSILDEFWGEQGVNKIWLMTRFEEDIVSVIREELAGTAQDAYMSTLPPELGVETETTGTAKLVRLLNVAGQLIAILALFSRREAVFTEEHAHLFSLINEPCAIAVSNALKHWELESIRDRLREENLFLRQELQQIHGASIVGADLGLRRVMDLVAQVAPLDAPVLITGETGVGKEVVATAIHGASPRRDGPFVRVNCGAIAESLIDSELFGHEKGAFTGAAAQQKGRFERAQGGTIFLDEISELPLQAQTRLLRVLQSKEIERVGGQRPIALDIRVIAATNRDIRQMVTDGTFRKDLWFRLDVFPIEVPPLRERRGDIPALARHFLEIKAREQRRASPPALAEGAIDQLVAYDWPGNVRELANVVERAMILNPLGPIAFDWLGPSSPSVAPLASPPGSAAARATLDEAIASHIRRVLDAAGGRVTGPGGAAEQLGINPSTLRHRMRKLGIEFGRTRSARRS
jgi:transcriptional regulator with GAF, ATPase, and Fis domain